VIKIKQILKDEKDSDESFNKKIDGKIKEAKKQIEMNKYYMELIDHKISKIIKLPVVFAGKIPYITMMNNNNEHYIL